MEKTRCFCPQYAWTKPFVFLPTFAHGCTDRCFLYACYGNPSEAGITQICQGLAAYRATGAEFSRRFYLQQAKFWELRAVRSLSRLWQQQGKRAEAYALLAPIYGWFIEGFDTADLQEAKTL